MIESDFPNKLEDAKWKATVAEREIEDRLVNQIRNLADPDPDGPSSDILEVISAAGDVRTGILVLASILLKSLKNSVSSRRRSSEIVRLNTQFLAVGKRERVNASLAAGETAIKGDFDQSIRILSFKN